MMIKTDGEVVVEKDNVTQNWTTEIQPKTGWFDIDFKELFQYKDLIYLFVKRNYATRYKQTILGPLWLIISPVITVLLYCLVFGNLAGLSTDGAPKLVFYMASNAIWSYFASCINGTSTTFTGNATVFGKVYFPRLTTPIATVITSMLDLVIQVVLVAIIIVVYMVTGTQVDVNAWIFAVPLLILQCALLGLGCGIIVSSLTTKYRDLTVLVSFGVQLWMYASPVVYSMSVVPEKYQNLYLLNPVSPIIVIFRHAFIGGGDIPYMMWGISWITTIVVLAIGVILFSHIEKSFMDTV